MKSFADIDDWTFKDIDEYIDAKNVLVLFKLNYSAMEAEVLVHAKNMTENQKFDLKESIATNFGGIQLSEKMTIKVNEYAQKWYNKHVLKKISLVVNGRKK